MGVNNFLKEFFAVNMLKKKGYSLIEIVGNDGNVDVYYMRIKGNRKITINKRSYIINSSKRMMKSGMPVYRFHVNSSVGENKHGKIQTSPMDSDIMEEIVNNARMVGQNSGSKDKKTVFMMLGMGVVVGIMVGVMIAGAGFI